jgi:4-hydroxy-tetrahydrodipicolinate reductase
LSESRSRTIALRPFQQWNAWLALDKGPFRMRDPIRILVLGTGQMGSGIARLVHRKDGLRLVGAYARRAGRAGIDLGRAIGLDRELGLSISSDLGTLIEETRPEVAIQATCSTVDDALDEVTSCVRRGVHVISIAEEMTFPEYRAPQTAVEIDRLAATHNVSVLGTGVNPGFVLDLLVVVLSGVCADVRSISATRINDLSSYGPTVLAKQGVGLAPEAFRAGLADGSVVGHIGFPESIHMIGRALGWRIARIEEQREPIVAHVRRATPFVTVEPGHVAGCRHTAVGYMGGEPVITLTHPQQIQPQLEGVETGDTIEIRGTPHVRLAGSPEIPGGIATAALAVNMVPRIMDAPPGLHCMTDLPVPAALLGDVRGLLRRSREEHLDG